ncbi:MAG: gamma-glutamyl-gamma-aminobutyrate hydrolase family protein [Rhodobacteraceae bacterium]|nr:gamma-glutamyl-gamma-aminobutyrate hydrolase family protein [Paracoccaceae bacterium]
MQIGILQTGHAPEPVRAHAGDYEDMFARLLAPEGLETRCWNVVDGVFPDSPCAADGWLITGSRHGVYEDHPWIPPLEDFLRAALDAGRPVVGICFGHQIMAQAVGGRTFKLKYGHRGPNQPVKELSTGRVQITSQNHGYAVEGLGESSGDARTTPVEITYVNLNDGTVEGMSLPDLRAFSLQHHPEAGPGPHDAVAAFQQFRRMVDGA